MHGLFLLAGYFLQLASSRGLYHLVSVMSVAVGVFAGTVGGGNHRESGLVVAAGRRWLGLPLLLAGTPVNPGTLSITRCPVPLLWVRVSVQRSIAGWAAVSRSGGEL